MKTSAALFFWIFLFVIVLIIVDQAAIRQSAENNETLDAQARSIQTLIEILRTEHPTTAPSSSRPSVSPNFLQSIHYSIQKSIDLDPIPPSVDIIAVSKSNSVSESKSDNAW